MFKNRSNDGRLNISGLKIRKLRKAMPEKTSQRAFAYLLQLQGLDLEKNAIQRIESGERFVTDIERKAISIVLNVSVDELLTTDDDQKETDQKET